MRNFSRYPFFLIALCLYGLYVYPQRSIEPSRMKQFNITVNADDHISKAQMLSSNENIKAENDKMYMWYGSQKIMETKGGFSGRLIHGDYSAFYLNSQLKEQGEIRYGLKNKEWKYWYPNGNLREIIHWSNGSKNGTYLVYNDLGQLMAKGRFKNDKLHGKFYTYNGNGGISEKKRYRHGNEIIPHVQPQQTLPDIPIRHKRTKEKKEKKQEPEEPVEKPKAPVEKLKDPKTKSPSFFTKLFRKKAKPEKSVEQPIAKRKIITS